MTREKIVYYFLVILLFASVIVLISWWNSIEQRINLLPQTGSGVCGVFNVNVSSDGISYTKEITLDKDYDKFYLKITDNSDNSILCAETELALLVSTCVDESNSDTCEYSNLINDWGAFSTNLEGISRIDQSLFSLSPDEYRLQFKEQDSIYALSNPIKINVRDNNIKEKEEIDLSKYLIFEVGDVFTYESKSFLAKENQLVLPEIGTTRIEVEHDSLKGEYILRPIRIMKDKSSLYWHPIPIGQESNGNYITADESLRLFMISPLNKVNNKKAIKYNEYIWALGHQSYLRTNDIFGLRDLKIDKLNQEVIYKSSNYEVPGVFFGKKIQSIPALYYQKNSLLNEYSDNIYSKPDIFSNILGNRSYMLRIERENYPLVIKNIEYSDVIRIDIYEGLGNFDKGDMYSRETWYLARGVGIIKIDIKLFNTLSFGGLSDNYNYINNCGKDSDCLSDKIFNPNIKLELTNKTSLMDFNIELISEDNNGYNIEITNSNYTGYVESKFSNGDIIKALWFENGKIYLPKAIFLPLENNELSIMIRQYIPYIDNDSENTLLFENNWSNSLIIKI